MYSSLSLAKAKAALLLATSISHYIGLRPSQPSASKDAYRGQHLETMILIWALASRMVIGALSVANALVVVAISLPFGDPRAARILEAACPYPSRNVRRIASLDIPFIVGVMIVLVACGLRIWCYTALGRPFTYRGAATAHHKLITTGPYTHVRHPGYTAVFLMLVGASITYLFAPNNYIHDGLPYTGVAAFAS
ncbi:hypothetical protein HGRIS_010213 [Hohenbuehelia grisea]|uniref:Protein-S-isoprenylcysteine O-methyltransferase n=1 Tax=Hohenbuehelia grisea TaxID=104357 RepID=A0ABR3J3Y4_9AGAR